MKIIINNFDDIKLLSSPLYISYMSSNFRWFLDSQHSSSFKAEQEISCLVYIIILNSRFILS